MSPIKVDHEKCNHDGICVNICPSGVLHLSPDEQVPVAGPDFGNYCLSCGHCVGVCPTGALSLDWLGPDGCRVIEKDNTLSPVQAEQFLRSRRSIRRYKPRPVEREKIEKLLRIACYAPSAKNNQPWNWIIVEDAEKVRALAKLVVDWMRLVIEEQPQMAAQLSFTRVVASWEAGEERVCRGAPHIIVAHADKSFLMGAEDCALALSYLELYAPVIGLGACWGGYFYSAVNAYPPLKSALGLPDDHRAFGAVMVGYPKFRYQRMPERRQPRVHWI